MRQGEIAVHQEAAWAGRRPGEGASEHGHIPLLRTEPGAKVRALVKMFLRRRWLILTMLLALNALAVVALQQIQPRYRAEASLIIGTRQAQVLDLKAVLAGLSGESEVIESEIQLLRSRKVVRQVVQQLKLDKNLELNPPPTESRLALLRAQAVAFWNQHAPARLRIPEPAAHAADAGPKPRDPLAVVTDNVLKHVSVTPKGRSRVVTVSFESSDPVLAAAVANEIANTYIADQLNAKREATANAHKWLEDRVAEMREQVINADRAVADYRRRAGITVGRTGNLLSEQISTLGEQVIQARAARAAAEARLTALRSGNGRRLETIPEAEASPTILALKTQQSTLLAQVADLSRNLGDHHPKVGATRAALAAVDGRIHAEIAKIAATLQQEAQTARAREALLTANLASLRKDVSVDADSEVELRALEHEAQANRALYDRLLARSRETNVEGGLQQPDAQVISTADPPERPSYPNPAMILPIFFLTSCIATVLVVFAVESFDHGFSSLDDVEQWLGVRALGVVPRLRRRFTQRNMVHRQPLQTQTAFAEAVRNLHTGLMLSGSKEPPKVVLVTSAIPGEGKSSVVLSLARLMASCGKRVVVVDCDLRRAALHKAFGGSAGPGLVDCLTGAHSAADVMQSDAASPALLIAAGRSASAAPDLFASEEMRGLLSGLASRFDLVLLDSSPILAASETRHLCRLAEKTVLVVRWQSTRRLAVAAAVRQVLEAGGSVAGILLTMVDLRQFARHSSLGFYQRQIGLYLSE